MFVADKYIAHYGLSENGSVWVRVAQSGPFKAVFEFFISIFSKITGRCGV